MKDKLIKEYNYLIKNTPNSFSDEVYNKAIVLLKFNINPNEVEKWVNSLLDLWTKKWQTN